MKNWTPWQRINTLKLLLLLLTRTKKKLQWIILRRFLLVHWANNPFNHYLILSIINTTILLVENSIQIRWLRIILWMEQLHNLQQRIDSVWIRLIPPRSLQRQWIDLQDLPLLFLISRTQPSHRFLFLHNWLFLRLIPFLEPIQSLSIHHSANLLPQRVTPLLSLHLYNSFISINYIFIHCFFVTKQGFILLFKLHINKRKKEYNNKNANYTISLTIYF